jgi:uncharacterized protein (DUF488 family)
MEVYSIGFTKKTAKQFFELLKREHIARLLDVRLNNVSQLAGFTKRQDLEYLLRAICNAEYLHEPLLAPTREILDDYKKKRSSWAEYERRFLELLAERDVEHQLNPSIFSVPTVLLCSEVTPDRCHRRLVLEYLNNRWGNLMIKHL